MSKTLLDSFIPFLDSLTFKSASAGQKPLAQLCSDTPAMTDTDDQFVKPAISLYQTKPTEVTISGFRQKILRCLRDANHVATIEIADAVLGCCIGAKPSGSERAAFLDEALNLFRETDVSHFFILPNPARTETIHFEGYRLGALDMPVLKSRCNRAQSDFAQLYSGRLAGRVALQSPEFKHVVINFLTLGIDSELWNKNTWRDLVLNYFERVSRKHFEFMWAHLDRTQMLGTPFDANLLDVQNFRGGMGNFAQLVTIYLDLSRLGGGYVVPENSAPNLNQPGPDSEVFTRFAEHRRSYRLSEVGDSELGRTLFACAGFCQQAIRFLEAGRTDDAALYATICLEHLFSEKKSTSEAVCTRAAALTYLRLAASYSEAEKELRKLYDARSAFVHLGASVAPAQADRLIAYARETLRSLLVLHFKPENRSQSFLEKWVKELDFIVAGFEASRTFEASFLADCGIFKS